MTTTYMIRNVFLAEAAAKLAGYGQGKPFCCCAQRDKVAVADQRAESR